MHTASVLAARWIIQQPCRQTQPLVSLDPRKRKLSLFTPVSTGQTSPSSTCGSKYILNVTQVLHACSCEGDTTSALQRLIQNTHTNRHRHHRLRDEVSKRRRPPADVVTACGYGEVSCARTSLTCAVLRSSRIWFPASRSVIICAMPH
jgi:hypothetical protein